MMTRSCWTTACLLMIVLFLGNIAHHAAGQDAVPAADKDDPKKAEVKKPPLSNEDLQKLMDKPLPELTFEGVGFADVVDFLRDVTGTNINVNWRALEAAGIDRNAPATARLWNVKFSKALRVVLDCMKSEQDSLDYIIDDGILTISTKADLGTNTITKNHDVSALLAGPKGAKADPGAAKRREAALLKAITVSVEPKSWKVNGGAGGTLEITDGKLTVIATEENQKAVASLLEQLRELTK